MSRNKPHKERFRSKHELYDKKCGRVVVDESNITKICKSHIAPRESKVNKSARKKLHSVQKKNSKTPFYSQKNSSYYQHRNVGIVAANEAAKIEFMLEFINHIFDCKCEISKKTFSMKNDKNKFAYTFALENECNGQEAIDIVKVSDFVVLIVDVSTEVRETINTVCGNTKSNTELDEMEETSVSTWYSNIGLCITEYTRNLLSVINAQGSPNIIVVLTSSDQLSDLQRRKILQIHQRYFFSVLHDCTKVFFVQKWEEFLPIFRHIEESKLRVLKWREQHPYLLVDDHEYNEHTKQLIVKGYLKGAKLSSKQLMHLTNFDTYQISEIRSYSVADDAWIVIDESSLEEREELKALQLNDTYDDGDHLSEGDVEFFEEQSNKNTHRVRVPIGVSEYQAAWYDIEENRVDGDVNSDIKHNHYCNEKELNEEEEFGKVRNFSKICNNENRVIEEYIDIETDDARKSTEVKANCHYDVIENNEMLNTNRDMLTLEEDMQSYKTAQTELEFLRADEVIREERMTDEERLLEIERIKELEEDAIENADVVATPLDIPARQRFAKYRGLKSFRTGVWDVNENLPPPYAYIFKLQGYNKLRSLAVNALASNPVPINRYISITLEQVPISVNINCSTSVLIASAQLQHEQKWSVLQSQMQRASEMEEEPIKSKTPLFAHIGFRKYYVSPLFSEITPDNRSKFIRILQTNHQFCISSFYGPISYNPCPVLFYEVPSLEEQINNYHLKLVAFGSTLEPNPDFVILKKATLSGRVAVIHKKQIVIKYMFFNDADVRWFSPVDLYTKFGRRGKIIKPIGTHGLFKAALNDQVMQHDVVYMDLYKRVFPKWTTVPYNAANCKKNCEEKEYHCKDDEEELQLEEKQYFENIKKSNNVDVINKSFIISSNKGNDDDNNYEYEEHLIEDVTS